jgi:hypothetical protein
MTKPKITSRQIAPYAGWQTQRNFVLDGLKQVELLNIAGKAQTRHRPKA